MNIYNLKQITMTQEFTKEELRALENILQYASETITIDDEPLLNIIMQKVDKMLHPWFEELT